MTLNYERTEIKKFDSYSETGGVHIYYHVTSYQITKYISTTCHLIILV